MKKDTSTECWNNFSTQWIKWVETPDDNDYRSNIIMPFTLKSLGNVSGKTLLDIGCGEGGYSRALAKSGAIVTAVDCSEAHIDYAVKKATDEGLSITHLLRNSCDLEGIADGSFDIVLSSMMLMDCEDFDGTVKEIARVLKPNGRVFASVMHPCFNGEKMYVKGKRLGKRILVVEDYYNPTIWSAPMGKGKGQPEVLFRHRTLEDYVKTFTKHGLRLTDLHEPIPDKEQVKLSHRFERLTRIPMFLFFELVKEVSQ